MRSLQFLLLIVTIVALYGFAISAINQNWPMIWLFLGTMAGCGAFYIVAEVVERRMPPKPPTTN